MKRAIVLSGGGGKGAYQIGVWKALRKMHISYDIVTGTSVGALNGAYMVQKDYIKALIVWKQMNFGQVYNKVVAGDVNTIEGMKEVASMYAKGIIVDGGMDIHNLEMLVEKTFNEKKFRKSNIDFGLVTVNLSEFKPIELTKKEIPKGKVKDYLMASATCYPVFKKKEIGEKTYIDGGMYDNLPVNLAIKMGAEEIIAVDLKAVGIKQKVKDTSVKVTTISPRNRIQSFLVFDKAASNRAIHLGYNDTMKTFHKLDGNTFTFKKGHLAKNYKKYSTRFLGIAHTIFHFNRNKSLMDKIVTVSAFHKLFKDSKEKEIHKIMLQTIEYLGKIFDMNEENIYDIHMYNRVLLDKVAREDLEEVKNIDKLIKLGNVKKLINTKQIIEYIFVKTKHTEENNKYKKELASLALVFSKEFLAALYLYTISD
ncbi:MAG: patatin-like phospholipase family protein [Bacilli bacterium]|nr:patatin-like phospholipase family protein [Bacilli bacterium]